MSVNMINFTKTYFFLKTISKICKTKYFGTSSICFWLKHVNFFFRINSIDCAWCCCTFHCGVNNGGPLGKSS